METQKQSPITGKEGSEIELEVAASWTKNYRDKHPGETVSQFFGKEILEKILAQPNCLGIRFYYAHDKPLSGWQRFIVSISNFLLKVVANIEGEKHLIMAGAMSDGNDQLPKKLSNPPLAAAAAPGVAGGQGQQMLVVADQSLPCPGRPGCPQNVLAG
jgi:hypothetical protein